MEYTILNTVQQGEIVLTDVELKMNDGSIILTQVAHFRPSSQEEIIRNIEMRWQVEQYKLDNTNINQNNGNVLL